MADLTINGIDFDKRLEDARELIHGMIDGYFYYAELNLQPEKNVISLVEYFRENMDQFFGLPKQK